jgi:hypothetical protein
MHGGEFKFKVTVHFLNKREGVQIKKNSTDIGSFSKRDAVCLNLKQNWVTIYK